ncbi:DNA translocase FtsK, partial [Staphylococcus sp. SIMBA_130]
MLPKLKKIKSEMTRRGDKLDAAGVNSIDQLKEKLPYIIICVDEVRLLKKETDVMDILEEISSIGRSLGIFIILSMQRPDSKLLEGALKVNCTVRMGFKTADAINSKVIGTPGAEKIKIPGRMI